MKHQGKKALVTGGTRGIGRAIALRFAREGADLVLNYLDNAAAAEETVALIAKESPSAKVHLVQANLSDMDEARKLAEDAAKLMGSVDYFVHSAALGTFKKTCDVKPNQWDMSMNINVKSFLVMAQKLKPGMKRGSVMIGLSSSGSTRVVPNYGAIGISKATLEALVRYLAVDYIPDGIRVNAVSGGFIDTKSLTAFPEYERMKQEVIARTPAKAVGRPEDLANIVSFLCSDDASWIIGQTLLADGGLSLV
ncbi:MAG: SDR family oxidoreductase [Candidatus Omnitrophica bacterium]|nr:SDR family oxidoreductase [Candidatus Omnitrophota bacterium]